MQETRFMVRVTDSQRQVYEYFHDNPRLIFARAVGIQMGKSYIDLPEGFSFNPHEHNIVIIDMPKRGEVRLYDISTFGAMFGLRRSWK